MQSLRSADSKKISDFIDFQALTIVGVLAQRILSDCVNSGEIPWDAVGLGMAGIGANRLLTILSEQTEEKRLLRQLREGSWQARKFSGSLQQLVDTPYYVMHTAQRRLGHTVSDSNAAQEFLSHVTPFVTKEMPMATAILDQDEIPAIYYPVHGDNEGVLHTTLVDLLAERWGVSNRLTFLSSTQVESVTTQTRHDPCTKMIPFMSAQKELWQLYRKIAMVSEEGNYTDAWTDLVWRKSHYQ